MARKKKDPEAPYSTPLPGAKPGQNIAKKIGKVNSPNQENGVRK